MSEDKKNAQVVGAIVHGVAHVHQGLELSVLDEDEFFKRTAIRISWPGRVALQRLLQEDVLLQDVRSLIHEDALRFSGEAFELKGPSDNLSDKRMDQITALVHRVNQELPSTLAAARDKLKV